MSVYVDEAVWPFGRMFMCHVWADTDDELLAMMDKIRVDRKWIQGHPTLSFGKHKSASWVHFDISKGKRDSAIKYGAIPCDRFEALIHCARLDLQSQNLYTQQRGRRRMALAAYGRLNESGLVRLSALYYWAQAYKEKS